MERQSEARQVFWAAAGLRLTLALAVSLPYLYAAAQAGPEAVFGGFLLNPLDGNSYLAKMQQGLRGEWLFRLPYTAEPGEPVFLFVFYIFLGQAARWSGLAPLIVFHAARILAVAFMAAMLARFFARLSPAGRPELAALALAVFGGGLGWLALLSGAGQSGGASFPPDLWVAEIYPFLSAYANPHFPLGLGLLLAALTRPGGRQARRWSLAGWLLAGGLQALILPFAPLVAAAALLGLAVWNGELASLLRNWRGLPGWLRSHTGRAAWILAGAAPILAYDALVAARHPVLSGWNAQNLTPTPPAGLLLLALSPAALLALAALPGLLQRRADPGWLCVAWALAGLGIALLPLGLQRRFLLGVFIPLAWLAGQGVEWLAGQIGRRRLLWGIVVAVSLPSNLIVLLTAVYAARTHDPAVYISRPEMQALAWIAAETPPQALILADERMSLLIPAHTGRGVFTGHPFETVNAPAEAAAVKAFFSGEQPSLEAWLRRGADYLVWPGEAPAEPPGLIGVAPVFIAGPIRIYTLPP